MQSFLNPIAKPIAAVLAAFYSVIPNFGVDILVLALFWMVIISPLTLKSTRSMLAMQALQPELKRLQEKHRNDRQAFAQAQMDLFRERGVSPWGSCLPTILPLPVFFALFQVIDGLSQTVKVHGVLTPEPRYLDPHSAIYHAITKAHGQINAFGLNLAKNPLSPHSSFVAALPFYLLLLVMIGTQYYQTAMTMNRNPAAQQNPQMKMMKYIPIIFGIICIRFPAGVILYYAMSNVCRIGQQWAMYRYDPKVKALVVTEVNEVEAKTREIDRATGPNKGPSTSKSAPTTSTPPAGRPRLRDLLAGANGTADQSRPSNGGAAREPGTRPTKRAAPAAKAKSGGQGTLAPGAKSGKGNPGTARKAIGDGSGRPAAPANGSRPDGKPTGKGSGSGATPASPTRAVTGSGSNGSGSNGSGGGQRAASGVPRTGAGAGRNIPPRSGRSKKRRGR